MKELELILQYTKPKKKFESKPIDYVLEIYRHSNGICYDESYID